MLLQLRGGEDGRGAPGSRWPQNTAWHRRCFDRQHCKCDGTGRDAKMTSREDHAAGTLAQRHLTQVGSPWPGQTAWLQDQACRRGLVGLLAPLLICLVHTLALLVSTVHPGRPQDQMSPMLVAGVRQWQRDRRLCKGVWLRFTQAAHTRSLIQPWALGWRMAMYGWEGQCSG